MIRIRVHHGWTNVAVAFLCMAFVFGASGATLPLVYAAAAEEQGWSLTEAALLFTYKNAASAVSALLLFAPLVRRFGLRAVMIGSLATTALGMGAFVTIESLSWYYTVGTLLGLGSTTSMIGANLLVSRWFRRNQGLALGLALAGTSFGGALFPLAAAPLIEAIGWRAAMAHLSVVVWLIVLPVYIAKAREEPRPEEPTAEHGGREGTAPAVNAPRSAVHSTSPLLRRAGVLKIAGALLIVAAVDNAVLQHTPRIIVTGAGVGMDAAASALSLAFAFGVVGKPLAGKLYDVGSLKAVTFWYLFVASSVALGLAVTGGWLLILFASARGLAHGGLIPQPAVLARHCCGHEAMNTTLPLLMGVWLVGAGVGPALLALCFERTGAYDTGLLLSVVLLLAAVLLVRSAAHRNDAGAARSRLIAPDL